MRQLAGKNNRALVVGYVVVLLMVVFLGVRTEQTVAAVLGGSAQAKVEPKQDSAGARILAEIERRYQQLAEALPSLRDPFRDPPVPRSEPQRSRRRTPPPQPTVVYPTIRSLLYDEINPSVKLSVGDQASGWLHVGSTFQGWTVREITAEGVRVADRDGKLFQIRAR